MKLRNTIKTIFLLLIAFYGMGQGVTFTPVPISIDRSFTNIVGMCQDKEGFLWLADNYNGLLKYDGSRLVSYKSNPRNSNSLISDNLECLFTGSKGNIWIGSAQNGLDSFDPETETFKHFQHDDANHSGLCSNMISALLEDHNGTLWVGTNNGLDTLNRQTGKFTHIENNTADGLALGHEEIRVIYEDKFGTIWIGCGNPFANDSPQLHGLYKFDKPSRKITRYHHEPDNSTSLSDNRVRAIFEDSRGVFWVGTAGDGLHIMDRAKGTFQRCLYDPKNPNKLSRPSVNKHSLYAVDHITFINEDMQGCIWIGTYANGINRYNPATKTIEYFGILGEGSKKIPKNDFWGLLKTKDNLLWASGWEPANDNQVLYKISTLPKQFKYTHIGEKVNVFTQDSKENMWLGTNKGLLLKNNNDTAFKFDNSVISQNYVTNLKFDSLDNVWVSTLNGLYYQNKIAKTFTSFRHDEKKTNSIASNNVFAIEPTGNGTILIGTNRGLDLFNTNTGIFKHFTYNPKDSSSISNDRITCIKKDKLGNIWVGTSKGLNRFDMKTEKFNNDLDLDGSVILFIFEDSRNRIWIGTYRAGLYVSTNHSKQFTMF